MSTPPLFTTLNELIQISADASKAFAYASHRACDPGLKLELQTRSQFCERSIHELRTLVGYLGGYAVAGGSRTAAASRGGVAAAMAGNDDLAVLEDIERSEDRAKAAYGKALNTELPLDVRSTVEQQYACVLRQHDLTRVLRDSYRHAA